ncbi:hypothetical protein [Blastopirellula marina]|uniref:Uncharacterized protein n=1 Tax=Blastopirellula marina DSM 3645 TaxID=314230 RepID=A3ZRN3_9BACT|nr:hypothetical protein [Blastopirellula marina]EAQ80802.1 hypothetical protein DSM3645_12316 [Blastopirellula marina DSM 3645]
MPQFSLRALALFTALVCGSLTALRYPAPMLVESLQLLWPALLIVAACLAIGCRGSLRSLFIGFLIASLGAYYWDDSHRTSVRTIPTFSAALADNFQRHLLNGYLPEYDGLTTFSLDPHKADRVHYVKKDKDGNVLDRGTMPLRRVQNFGINKAVLPVQPDRVSYIATMKILSILWIGGIGAAIAYYADQASKRRRDDQPPRKKKDPPEAAGLA